MTAERLLRLYPRAWRTRYGDEFLAMAGRGRLGAQQTIDVVFGAIDAWLSADVRRATVPVNTVPDAGGPKMTKSWLMCETSPRYTRRDSLIGGGVMLASATLFALSGVALRRNGWPVTGEILTSLSYSASLLISMPFWLTKGQPWKAQAVIIGFTLAVLVAIGYLAAKI